MGIETATAVLLASGAMAGASAYSARMESKAAKKAAESQADVAKMEIQATKDSSIAAAEEAKAKLKLKQAKRTQSILTPPMGVEDNVNKSILGV